MLDFVKGSTKFKVEGCQFTLKHTKILNNNGKGAKLMTNPSKLGGLVACTKYNIEMLVENVATKKSFTYSKSVYTKFNTNIGKVELKVDKAENDSASLSWNILHSDASCILKYEVVVSNRDNQQVFEALNIKSTSIVVPNLSSCEVYSAKVTAITAREERIQSSGDAFRIKSSREEVVDMSKLDLNIDNINDDSVSLSWSSDSTKCLQEYQLKMRKSDDKIVYENKFYNNSVIISDLTSCNNYSVELVALRDDRSAMNAVIKSFYMHALPVTNVTIAVKKSSAQIRWIPPANLDCVTNFTISYDIEDCQNEVGENASCFMSQTIDKSKTTAKLSSLPLSKRFSLKIHANEVTFAIDASRAKTWQFNTIDYERFFVKNINANRLNRTQLQLIWGFEIFLLQQLKHFEIFIDGRVFTTNKQTAIVDVAACSSKKNMTIAVRCVSIDGFEGANVTHHITLNDDAFPLSPIKDNFTFEQKNEILIISWSPEKSEESCIAYYDVDFFETQTEVKEPRFETTDFDPCVPYVLRVTPVSYDRNPGDPSDFEFTTKEFGEFSLASEI